MDNDLTTVLTLNEPATKLLLRAVNKYIEKWPGGNPDDQICLKNMQKCLQAAVLEYNFNQPDDPTRS